jgi:hypothetical protein
MPTRSARTAWNGGLQDGSGQVELTSSGAGTFDVSFPKRAADDADGTTSPEELVAALEVELGADEFPGVAFHEPVPDWRGYRTLIIDVANPAAEPLDLVVRVHDRYHNRTFNDRFNRNYPLAAGERRTLRISLEDIRHGPRQRLMDMAHISDITLFRGGYTGSRQMRVYSLRLE